MFQVTQKASSNIANREQEFGRSAFISRDNDNVDFQHDRFVRSLDETSHNLTSLFSKTFKLYQQQLNEENTHEILEEGSGDTNSIIANIFWRPQLAFHGYTFSEKLVEFNALFLSFGHLKSLLVEAYQGTGLRTCIPDMCLLTARCGSARVLDVLHHLKFIDFNRSYSNVMGMTLLHIACLSQNLDVVLYLCGKGVSFKAKDIYGRKPIDVCYSSDIAKLVRPRQFHSHLQKSISAISITATDKCKLFNSINEDIDCFERVQLFLQNSRFDVNSDFNDDGYSLFHCVVMKGLSQLAQVLCLVYIQQVDVNILSSCGMTPLMLAVTSNDLVIADVLLCILGCNPNIKNPTNGWTASHYAADCGDWDMLNCLIKRGANLNIEDDSGCRADDICHLPECKQFIENWRCKRIERLSNTNRSGSLKHKELWVEDLYQLDNNHDSLVIIAAKYNKIDNLVVLLNKIKDNNIINAQHIDTGQTALSTAASLGFHEIVSLLLKYECNAAIGDMCNDLPLHHAVRNKHSRVVEILLQHNSALTGLSFAASLCDSAGIRTLLQDAMQRRQEELVTPVLFESSLNGDAAAIYAILELGDDVNPISGVGEWPIYLATINGHRDVVQLLYQNKADLDQQHSSTHNTILHAAAGSNQYGIICDVLKLLDRDASLKHILNTLNAQHKSALQIAAEKGYSNIVDILLSYNATTNTLNTRGELFHSEFQGIQFIIEEKRKQHLRNVMGAIKVKKGALEKLKSVWQSPLDHNLRDSSGHSPLMLACLPSYRRLDVVQFLLNSAIHILGVVPKQCEQTTASVMGKEGFIKSLEHSLVKNLYTPERKSSALSQTSIQSDLLSSLDRSKPLERYTTEQNISDTLHCHIADTNKLTGATGYHYAIDGSDNLRLLDMLLRVDCVSVNIQNDQGLTPLHYACQLGNKKCVQYLCSFSFVDLNLRTLSGQLPEELTTKNAISEIIHKARTQIQDSPTGSDTCSEMTYHSAGQTPSYVNFDTLNARFLQLKQQNNIL